MKKIIILTILLLTLITITACKTVIVQVPADDTNTKKTVAKPTPQTTTTAEVKTQTEEPKTYPVLKPEKCELEEPFSCINYRAVDGFIYFTLKLQSYQSKAEQIYIQLGSTNCMPSNAKIEPGQNKEFYCKITDTTKTQINSEITIDYYNNIERMNKKSKGTLIINI